MDMRDALIEVKEFSNDNNELDESLIGLLLKQISDRLKVNKTKDDVQKTIAEGFIVLSLLFINIEDMIKRNSYISASGGLFSDRTYNLLRKIEKRIK